MYTVGWTGVEAGDQEVKKSLSYILSALPAPKKEGKEGRNEERKKERKEKEKKEKKAKQNQSQASLEMSQLGCQPLHTK